MGSSTAIEQRFTASGAKLGPGFIIGATRTDPYVADPILPTVDLRHCHLTPAGGR